MIKSSCIIRHNVRACFNAKKKGAAMKLIPQGDYYVWYCDWCDSRNHTLWTRVEKGKVVCGVCYNPFVVSPFPKDEMHSAIL